MFNPTRRSRQIGTRQGGRVKHGRAEEKLSRLRTHEVWRQLSSVPGPLQLLRENPSGGFYHPCTLEEYVEVLHMLPAELGSGLSAIVLRRSSKSDVAFGVEGRLRFRCILINSFPVDRRMVWDGPPAEHHIRHYRPWCTNWIQDKGQHWLEWSIDEIRRYYLFHLFLHELGHINQPPFHALKRREDFAEGFALQWAKMLGVLAG